MADKPTPAPALGILWREVAQEHFLNGPTAAEALAVLKQRREMVQRMLDLKEAKPSLSDGAARLLLNHFHTLLKAKSAWLERALTRMRMSMDSQSQR